MNLLDTGVPEASATRRVADFVDSQDDLKQYLAAQAALRARMSRQARLRECAAAAVGMVWLIVSVGALLVAHGATIWP